jgi:hypothetical protein
MHAPAISTTRRERSEQARARAIIRFNGLLFHSLAAASFLESAEPLGATRLGQVFAARPEAGAWLEQSWLPRRATRGRRLRDYLEATWPEFEWSAAYEEYRESCRPRPERGVGVALGALGQCVTAAQAAVFYRALARSADDPALRELAREAAHDHGEYFDYFRALFERSTGEERVGLVAGWRAVRAGCRAARDTSVREAFEPLARHWRGAPTVPALDYGEFRIRMVALIQRYTGIGKIERLLFQPWLEHERSTPAPQLPETGAERRLLPVSLPAAA